MTLTFVMAEFGKVEINLQTRLVYFFKDDFETALEKDNTFVDMWNRPWRLIHDTIKKNAFLEVSWPKTVATLIY